MSYSSSRSLASDGSKKKLILGAASGGKNGRRIRGGRERRFKEKLHKKVRKGEGRKTKRNKTWKR